MMHRDLLLVAAILGASGVLAGAFAAHALEAWVPAADLAIWETAARYQLLHAVVVLLLGTQAARAWRLPALLLTVGVLFFSGSLYLLVVTGVRGLGAVTPIGGVLLVLGWVSIGWTAFRGGRP